VGNMIYGLKGMSCDHPEVIYLIVQVTRLVKSYNGPLTGQHVRMMIYGLQGLASDRVEVLDLIKEVTRLVESYHSPIIGV